MTKVFFDTEFTGLHKGTTLISIGIVSDCGKSIYCELTDYDKEQVDDWIKENVISKLYLKPENNSAYLREWRVVSNTEIIKEGLCAWFNQFEQVEMWSDCLSYDWVLFCDIWGHAFKIPKNIYYIPFDICTLFKVKGIDPDINREDFAKEILTKECFQAGPKHNAYWDATVIKACYKKLQSL